MLNIIPPHDYPRSPPRSQTYSEWANKFWNISFRKLDRKTLATLQYLFSSPFTCIILCRFSFRRPDSRNSFQWSAPYQVGGRTFQKVILSIGITQNDTMFSVKFFKHQVLWMLQPISQLMEFAIHFNGIVCACAVHTLVFGQLHDDILCQLESFVLCFKLVQLKHIKVHFCAFQYSKFDALCGGTGQFERPSPKRNIRIASSIGSLHFDLKLMSALL